MRVVAACVFLLLACARSAAHGQTLGGRLVDDRTGLAIAGGFVTLHDGAGARITAVLADTAGRFLITGPRAGRYTVRVERLGYRTFASEPFTLGETLVTREFRLPEQAIVLEGIAAATARKCTGRQDLAEAAATIWEELRKALAVTSWTARSTQVSYEIAEYNRELDPRDLSVRDERVRIKRISTNGSPYQSVSADDLLAHGFIRPAGTSWLYYGPDADVLLDDAFLDAHCFRAVTDRADPNLVGLAFEPASKRPGHAVAGTLWLDRRSFELRRIDYRYLTLPWDVSTRNVGGNVYFRRLGNGQWIVDAWTMRMPLLQQRPGRSGPFIGAYSEHHREVIATFDTHGERVPYERRGR